MLSVGRPAGRSGLTLVELLIVMILLGLVGGVIVTLLLGAAIL